MRSKQKMKERADRFVDTVIPRSLEMVANNTGEPMVQSNDVPAMLKQDSTVHLIKTAPADEFHTRPSSQEKLASIVRARFETRPYILKPYPPNGNFFLSSPIKGHTSATRFLIMRFDKVFDNSINLSIVKHWDAMASLELKLSEKRETRSNTKLCYLGVWEKYLKEPIITLDSRSQIQPTQAAMDHLLEYLGQHVIPQLNNLLYRYDQVNWVRQQT